MNDGKKKSIDIIQDLTKLIISLATGFLTLSAVFIKDIIKNTENSLVLIKWSWILSSISISAGLFTVSSLVNLTYQEKYEPFNRATTIPAIIQWLTFLVSLILFWTFTVTNLATGKQ